MVNIVDEKLSDIYLNYFKGRENFFSQQLDGGAYRKVETSFSKYYLTKHLNCYQTYGLYVLNEENKCHFVCIDIDIPKQEITEVDIKNPLNKFNYLKAKCLNIYSILVDLGIKKENILFEDTGGRGYHLWLFFETPVDGSRAITFYEIIKQKLDFEIEFFPKQGFLNETKKLGSTIKLPLGIHNKYQNKSRFFYLNDETPEYLEDIEQNIAYLEKIKKVKNNEFDLVIDSNLESINDVDILYNIFNFGDNYQEDKRQYYKQSKINNLLTKCQAVRKMQDKIQNNAEEITHYELFTLSNLMLSIESFRENVKDYIKKIFKDKYNEKETNTQIQNIEKLHPTSCNSLISKGLCDGSCTYNWSNKTPLDVHLDKSKKTFNDSDILGLIADKKNLYNTFYKLKKYHKEDSLFFDEFDFEDFERDLDINIELISQAIKDFEDIPFIGYEFFEIPKKRNDDGSVEYRKLSYSSIYDQIIIQSFFNYIGQYFEDVFINHSLGYRMQLPFENNDIFEDWQEKYPYFRDSVLNKLREKDINYYICCDIKGFYDNIQHQILFQQINTFNFDNKFKEFLKKVISLYEFEPNSHKGVPQGPAYARILANLYLNDFDKDISSLSDAYYRYVDDCYILFKSEEDAKTCINKINANLAKLGLSLSNDPKKAPTIISASDEKIILEKIDTTQYAIFDEIKSINEQDKQKINTVYSEIKNKFFNSNDIGQIQELNGSLPSLLYFVSRNTNSIIEKELKEQVFFIINHLIEQGHFFSKRLDKIFYRIIPNIKKELNINIYDFFKKLYPVQQIYFIYTLFDISKREKKYSKDLQSILVYSLDSTNNYLKVIALTIMKNNLENLDINLETYTKDYLLNLFKNGSNFVKIKILQSFGYSEINKDIRNEIEEIVLNSYNYLEKSLLFSKISERDNLTYLSEVNINKLIDLNPFLFGKICCQLFLNYKSCGTPFEKLTNFIAYPNNYKSIYLNYLKKCFYQSYKNNPAIDFYSLAQFYEDNIDDEELKRILLQSISTLQIANAEIKTALNEQHVCEARYNECFLYKKKDNTKNYNYIEEIPENLAISHTKLCENILKHLSDSNTILFTSLSLDTEFSKYSIKYLIDEKLYSNFPIIDLSKDSDILKLISLIQSLYEQSEKYYHILKRIPHITLENILFNITTQQIAFKSIGGSLKYRQCFNYFGKQINIDYSDISEIPRLIKIFLCQTLFENKDEYNAFKKDKSTLNRIFLCYLLNHLDKDNEKYRIKYRRLNYLVNEYTKSENNSLFFITEQLKGIIFAQTNSNLKWDNILKSLLIFYQNIKNISRLNSKTVSLKNKNTPFKRLHKLSSELILVSSNIDEIFDLKQNSLYKNDFVFLDLLNCYSVLCIETFSIFKSIIKLNEERCDFEITMKETHLIYDDYSFDITKQLNNIYKLFTKIKSGVDIFAIKEYISADIVDYAIVILLLNSIVSVEEDKIILKTDKNNKIDLDTFWCNYVIRLDSINNQMNSYIVDINNDLSSRLKNNNFKATKNLIIEYCSVLNETRAKLKIKRYNAKYIKKDIYSNKSWCKFRLFFKEQINSNIFQNNPLSETIPTNGSKISIDVYRGKIINAISINSRVSSFINLYKNSWIQRMKFLYSGKPKIIINFMCLLSITCISFFIDKRAFWFLIIGGPFVCLWDKVYIDLKANVIAFVKKYK